MRAWVRSALRWTDAATACTPERAGTRPAGESSTPAPGTCVPGAHPRPHRKCPFWVMLTFGGCGKLPPVLPTWVERLLLAAGGCFVFTAAAFLLALRDL